MVPVVDKKQLWYKLSLVSGIYFNLLLLRQLQNHGYSHDKILLILRCFNSFQLRQQENDLMT